MSEKTPKHPEDSSLSGAFRIASIRRHRLAEVTKNPLKLRRWLLGGVAVLAVLFLLRTQILLVILNILSFILTPVLPSLDDRAALLANESTILYDREGNELYTIHGDENRFEIPLAKMPTSVINATIAAEDDQFYEHPGFDVNGIIAAVLSEIGIGAPRGGSTITQQFVKNAYLTNERSYIRKAKELLLAVKLENRFEKNEILEMYLNEIPYGGNAHGIQAAAQTFFAKNAEDLTLAESAVLAAIPQAPTRYSPFGSNRELLMGSCSAGGDSSADSIQSFDAAVLSLRIEAGNRVWIRVTADGKIAKEWTAQPGETGEFSFRESATIRTGDGELELFVNGARLADQSSRELTITRKNLQSLIAPEALAALAGQACESPDDPRYTPGRSDYVLRRMLALGYISEAQYETAWQEKNRLVFTQRRDRIVAPHFVFYVREILEQKYGKELVERGGLRVFTSLDPRLQATAEKLIQNAFPHDMAPGGTPTNWRPNYADASNGAFLAADTQTGEILAMVGSRDYFEQPGEDKSGNDGAVNLTNRLRQPGSSFKPFAYAAGFEQGYYPASVLWDVETEFGTEKYTPKNFDGTFWGPTTIRRALQGSRNIPAVKMAALVGEPGVVDLLRRFGFESVATDGRYGPTIGLGAAEVSMLEMVNGYRTFANSGKFSELTPILRVTDSQGNPIEEFDPNTIPATQAIDPEAAYLVTSIMSDASSRPAGWNSYITLPDRPSAAKTGTANRRVNRTAANPDGVVLPGDIWTVGYTPQIVAAGWVGNNDASPMNLRGEGLTIVAPIWRDFMREAHKTLPVLAFEKPAGIETRTVSRMTGLLATDSTPADERVTDVFASWGVPIGVDTGYRTIQIDRVSGKLPTEWTPPEAIISQIFLNLRSELPTNPQWEQPVRRWIAARYGSENPENQDSNSVSYGFPPTESDDVHTRQTAANAPRIAITSPTALETVPGGELAVSVSVTAPNGAQSVQFFRDGELVFTADTAPFTGRIMIPRTLPTGAAITIQAKVLDSLYYSDSSSIQVLAGERDSSAPLLQFRQPVEGSSVPAGATIRVELAPAAGVAIDSLELFLDGTRFAQLDQAPYSAQLAIPATASGTATISARGRDTAGNAISAERVIRIEPATNPAAAETAAPSAAEAPPALAPVTDSIQLFQPVSE